MEENKVSEYVNSKKVHPREKANVLSKLFFCWSLPIFYKGCKKQLNEDDLYATLKAHESTTLGNRLEEAWKHEIDTSENPSLWRALWMVFGNELLAYGIVLFFYEVILKLAQPLALGKLMSYYVPNQTEISKDEAYMYAGIIVLVAFIQVMVGHSYIFGLQHLGMKLRVACCSVIYRKSLRLSKTALVDTTIGQMVNLLSNDVNRFDAAMMHFHNLWSSPVETFLIMYLLYNIVGPTAIVGIGFLLIFIPLQMYMGKLTSVYRLQTAIRTDERVRLMSEIVNGIQVIKMYAWEKSFVKLVELARSDLSLLL